MHGHFFRFHVDGILCRTLAPLLGKAGDPFTQLLADTFALADHFDSLVHSLGIAPGQVYSAGILFRQDALLIQFHSEADDVTAGDRIHTIGVAQLVRRGDRRQVRDLTVATHRGKGLVFGTTVLRFRFERPLFDFDDTLAPDRAGIAAFGIDQDGLFHRLARDGVHLLEGTFAEVLRRLHTAFALARDVHRRTKGRQVVVVRIVHVVLGKPLGALFDVVGVLHVDTQGPTDRQTFQVLGTHHRTHTRASRRLAPAVDHTGVAHHLLTARPNPQVLDLVIAQLAADRFFRVGGQHAPQMTGIANLALAVLDPQVHRLLGLARDHHRIEACELELRPTKTARVCFTETTGNR